MRQQTDRQAGQGRAGQGRGCTSIFDSHNAGDNEGGKR